MFNNYCGNTHITMWQNMTMYSVMAAAWDYFGFKPTIDRTWIDDTSPVCHVCVKTVYAKSGNTLCLFSHPKNKHSRHYIEIKDVGKPSMDGIHQPTFKSHFRLQYLASTIEVKKR